MSDSKAKRRVSSSSGPGMVPTRPAETPSWTLEQPGESRAAVLGVDLSRLVLDSIAEGVVMADSRGTFVFSNRAAERILGAPLRTVPLSDWSAHFGWYCADKVTHYPVDELPLPRALRGEETTDCEIYLRRETSGEGLWVIANGYPIVGPTGSVLGGVIVFRDITRRKRQGEQVGLLSKVVEQTADGVVITDPEGTIEYVNPAFEQITGYPSADAVGKNPRMLKSGAHSARFYDGLWSALTNGHTFRGTFQDRRKCGEVFLSEQTITPIRDAAENITHLVSISKDVTESRRAAERERELLLARAVQQRLYPSVVPELAGFDLAGQAFIADVVGGDYWDIVSLGPGCFLIAIGDASGHGFDSALLMTETRAYLRSSARTMPDPGETLTRINRALTSDIASNRFVTLLVARLETGTRTLSYASAGHATGFIVDRAGAVKLAMTATGLILGPFPEAAYETRNGIELEDGDIMVLMTDGIVESEGPRGDSFGVENVLRVVRDHGADSADRIVEAVHSAARQFSQGDAPQDDMTIVVCKVTGGAAGARARKASPTPEP